MGALGPAEFRRRLEAFFEEVKAKPVVAPEAPVPTVEAEGRTPLTLGEEGYRAEAICVSRPRAG